MDPKTGGDNDRRHCRNASLEKLQEAFAKEQSAGEAKEPLGVFCTPPKFNIAPEEWWLEDEFPFGIAYF